MMNNFYQKRLLDIKRKARKQVEEAQPVIFVDKQAEEDREFLEDVVTDENAFIAIRKIMLSQYENVPDISTIEITPEDRKVWRDGCYNPNTPTFKFFTDEALKWEKLLLLVQEREQEQEKQQLKGQPLKDSSLSMESLREEILNKNKPEDDEAYTNPFIFYNN